jgi:hypothetical protein
MSADGSCALYHLTGRTAEKLPAPFPVRAVAAAADGSLWLAGWSKLVHLPPSELSEPAGECAGSGPRVTLPDVSRRGTVSLRVLRRAGGLRVRSSRAGTLLGRLSAGGLAVRVQQAVGPGGAVIRFPARAFDGIARRLADGKRTSVRLLEMRFLDADGNEGVNPDDPRVVR